MGLSVQQNPCIKPPQNYTFYSTRFLLSMILNEASQLRTKRMAVQQVVDLKEIDLKKCHSVV